MMQFSNSFADEVINSLTRRIRQKLIIQPGLSEGLDDLLPIVTSLIKDTEKTVSNYGIRNVPGGTNHKLFRVQLNKSNYAIKVASSGRSQFLDREYHALLFLSRKSISIAPKPIFFFLAEDDSAVLVQTWENGKISSLPPQIDEDWKKLIDHYLCIHRVKRDRRMVFVRKALVNPDSISNLRKMIYGQIEKVPENKQPKELKIILTKWDEKLQGKWKPPSLTLCRGDGNCRNFIRRPGEWVSVDWENSGWGDPAFDFASLLAHPAYVTVPLSRLEWAVECYCSQIADKSIHSRIMFSFESMLLYWAARYVNLLTNTDPTLPYHWKDRPALRKKNYHHYIDLAKKFIH